ncbi:MAG TPA: hypothetical protein VMK12_29720 [Anaeromyxobacteraceae bacterium]|nr:hypothetical protein [Anaeromyxobacteraceae bacterium]
MSVLSWLGALLLAAAPAPVTVGYARATSQLKSDSKPALYAPMLALDGRPSTARCEGANGEGVGEGMEIGFRGDAVIDEVRITVGDARDPESFQTHNRIKALELRTDERRHTFVLVDTPEPQSIKLARPIEASRVTLEITAVTRGTGDDNATCLTDIVFVSNGKPIVAPLVDKLGYDRGRSKLMGIWYAGAQGARDRFLEFYYDGTYRYVYRPFDPEEPGAEISGSYSFDGEWLRLSLPKKGWVEVKAAPQPAADGGSILALDAKALEGTLEGVWSAKP